jgi:hypothetical protein
MTPAEPPPEPVEPAADSPALADPPAALAHSASEQPALSEQDASFLHYLAKGRARRERRRRRLRVAVATLVVGASVLAAGLFWTRHQRPPIATRIIEPPEVKPWQSVESRAARPDAPAQSEGRTALSTEAPARPAPSPPAVSPPASPRTSEALRSAPTPVAPASPPATSTPAPAASPPAPGTPRLPEATAPAGRLMHVSYQPHERLKRVHAGDAKEAVFELFGTAFERQSGSLVRIEGMRLRARGRSAQHARVEVAEVRITDAVAAGSSLYWFLFGDDRLIAWGRAEEWPVATARYQVEIEYQPDPTPAGRRSGDRS